MRTEFGLIVLVAGLAGCRSPGLSPSSPGDLASRSIALGLQRSSASPRWRLEVQTAENEGIRLWYVTRYRLLERRADGSETEVWRDERREKYASHAISADGTVWIATQTVPGPGGGGLIAMRRRDDPRAATVGIGNLFAEPPPHPRATNKTPLARSHPNSLDLSRATALRLGSGAEQLRFESGPRLETRLTWLDAHGPSQFGGADVARFTVREATTGTSDPWTDALDRAPHPPAVAELKGAGALRFWSLGDRTLALRARGGWFWEWPVRLESVEAIPGPVVGVRSLAPWLVWARLDDAPKFQVAGADGRIVKSFPLARLGYSTKEEAQRGIDLETPRIRIEGGERPFVEDPSHFGLATGTALRYPIRDGGRLVLTLTGENAPRLDRESPIETIVRLLQKESDLPPGGALDERFVRSPSGRFRLRIRRRLPFWKPRTGETVQPEGYVVLLGRRTIGDRSIEVEMGLARFTGNELVEARVFDDGRFAMVEHHPDRATLLIWNPDGSQIAGIELTQGWYPALTQAKREFHIVGTPYRPEGATKTTEVAGVPVREAASASWTLPKAGGPRILHLARMNDGSVRTWWQGD